MKRGLLLVFFVITSFLVKGQGLPSFEGSKSTASVFLKKVIPPSPTAASLAKYGDQQINLFAGLPSVNIPVYDINTNGFSMPLSLSYSSSGMKVTEAASWVGLGWTLNGTGVISRVVKGAPDGLTNNPPLNIRNWPLPYSYTQPSDNAWNAMHTLLQLGIMDKEPDLFIVKAGSLSIKFYYDMSGRIQTIPYNNDIKIKFDAVPDQYIITDDDGTQYFFGGDKNRDNEITVSADYANYTSSWFLSKIITAAGVQILYKNKKGTNTILQYQYNETEEVKTAGQSGNCAGQSGAGRNTQWTSQAFFPVFLDTIETPQELIFFIRDAAQRADMPGDYALTEIKVQSKSTGNFEHLYSMSYSYFPQVSPTVCWGSTASPQHVHNQTAICKRLRLDNFKDKGNNSNTSGFKMHQFVYSTKSVPSRCSRDQDFWGYYNGAGNTSMLPAVSDPDFQSSSFNAASRESNLTYGDAGLLLKIIYPAGGETNFEYEPNEIKSLSAGPTFQTVNTTVSGIGVLLENSVNFTIANLQSVTLNFTLSDPNLLDPGLQRKAEILDAGGVVKYAALNSNSPASGVLVGSFTGGLPPGTYTLKVSRNYSYSSFPGITPVNLSASVKYAPTGVATVVSRKIGGFRVKKIADKTDGSGSEFNVKEFVYEIPFFSADIQNEDCISFYSRWFTASNPTSTYECGFKSRITTSVQPVGSIQGGHIGYGKVTCFSGAGGTNGRTEYYYSTDPDIGGFSLSPYYRPITSYDHRRGNLLKQIDYDAAGNMLKIKVNEYEYPLGYAGLYSSPYYTRDEPLIVLHDASLIPMKTIAFTDFALPSEKVRLKSTGETIYSGTNYLSNVQEFSYDNANYSYVTQTKTTNSKNNVITEVKKYPLDSKPAGTSSNEEIERKFETDYQTLSNNFITCDNAAVGATAINACYTTYQSGYDNLISNRATALSNYQSAFTTLANGTADPILKAKYQLISKNQVSELIESKVMQDNTIELTKTTNDYKDFSGNILLEKTNSSLLGNSLTNDLTINSYDGSGNVLQALPKDGTTQSFIWDYKNLVPVAKVVNATQANIAYTSFEAENKGNWTYTGTTIGDASAPTGKKCYFLGSTISKSSLSAVTTYIVSYWKKTGTVSVNSTSGTAGRTVRGWTYYQHTIVNPASGVISVTGTSALIDELRLYPDKALMTSYTFKPTVGMTSQCDPNNRIVYYEYDNANRLLLTRDQDYNLIKRYNYTYSGQTESTTLAFNGLQTGYFISTCTGCQIPVAVPYSVPANTYLAATVGDANQLALNDLAINGPIYATIYPVCNTPGTTSILGSNNTAISFTVQFHNTNANCSPINYNFVVNGGASMVNLGSVKEGNYDVIFSAGTDPNGYTYRVNSFTYHGVGATITEFISASATNQVRISTP